MHVTKIAASWRDGLTIIRALHSTIRSTISIEFPTNHVQHII